MPCTRRRIQEVEWKYPLWAINTFVNPLKVRYFGSTLPFFISIASCYRFCHSSSGHQLPNYFSFMQLLVPRALLLLRFGVCRPDGDTPHFFAYKSVLSFLLSSEEDSLKMGKMTHTYTHIHTYTLTSPSIHLYTFYHFEAFSESFLLSRLLGESYCIKC